MEKDYQKLINALSQKKGYKLLHKVGKQWVAISVITLALLGFSAVSGVNIHADTVTPKIATSRVQPKSNVSVANKKPAVKQQNQANVLHNRIVNSIRIQKATPKSINKQANVLHERILRSVMASKPKTHATKRSNLYTNSKIAKNPLANRIVYRYINKSQKRNVIYCATHSHQFLHHGLSNKSYNKVKSISYLPYLIDHNTTRFNHHTQPFYLGIFDGSSSLIDTNNNDYLNEKFITNNSYELGWIIGKGNAHLNKYIYYHSLDEFNMVRHMYRNDRRLVNKQTGLYYNYSANLEKPRTPLTDVNGVLKHKRIDGMHLSTINNRMQKSINVSRKRYGTYYVNHPSRYLKRDLNNIVINRLNDDLLNNYEHNKNHMLGKGETDASNNSDMNDQTDIYGTLISPKLMNNKIYKLGWAIAFADFVKPANDETLSIKDYNDALSLYNTAFSYIKKNKKSAKKYMVNGKFSLNDFLLYNPKHTVMVNKNLMYRIGYADTGYTNGDSSDVSSTIQRQYATSNDYRNGWKAHMHYLVGVNRKDANKLYNDGVNYMNKHNNKYGCQLNIPSDIIDAVSLSGLNKKPSEFYGNFEIDYKP